MTAHYLEFTRADDVSRANLPQLREDRFWSKGGDRELKLHRIHAYPAKFPAFIPTKALEFAREQGLKVHRVGDIFCGCGTVAFEARRGNIDFWGCDINPVATLIARTKRGSFDSNRLTQYYSDIAATVRRTSAQVNPRRHDCDASGLLVFRGAVSEPREATQRHQSKCAFAQPISELLSLRLF